LPGRAAPDEASGVVSLTDRHEEPTAVVLVDPQLDRRTRPRSPLEHALDRSHGHRQLEDRVDVIGGGLWMTSARASAFESARALDRECFDCCSHVEQVGLLPIDSDLQLDESRYRHRRDRRPRTASKARTRWADRSEASCRR
jgi:hypothetical protein